jgi:hypothetical protein
MDVVHCLSSFAISVPYVPQEAHRMTTTRHIKLDSVSHLTKYVSSVEVPHFDGAACKRLRFCRI